MESKVCIKNRVDQLERVDNSWSTTIDFRYTSILDGYIVEFVAEGAVSFSEAKRKFFQGPRGRYINSIPLWINMLLVKREMMSMESNTMVD